MKKILLSIIAIIAVFLGGIWMGRTQQQHIPTVNEMTEKDMGKAMKDLVPTYTVSGGLPKPSDKYRYLVDGWYGFIFRTTGSSCTDSDRQIVIEENKRADSILTQKNGKDWMQKFEKTVDSLYTIDTLAVDIARNDISVKKLIKTRIKKDSTQTYISYKCYPTTDKHLKVVSVEWDDEIYGRATYVSQMRAIVDLKEKKVKKIEDTETKANYFSE